MAIQRTARRDISETPNSVAAMAIKRPAATSIDSSPVHRTAGVGQRL
jgi:hypothetical protein